MFEVVNMDFAKKIDMKEAQVDKVASEIKELKTSLQNAAAGEKTEIKAEIARLQDEKIKLQGQLEELYKAYNRSK